MCNSSEFYGRGFAPPPFTGLGHFAQKDKGWGHGVFTGKRLLWFPKIVWKIKKSF